MTTVMKVTSAGTNPRLERYREAERALWSRYGIDPKERFVGMSGQPGQLRILEVGASDAPPVLFLPGTGGTGPYWAPLVRELPGLRCLIADRPGWGVSDPIAYSGRQFGELTSDILRGALDELGIERADVVGASIGNLWALWFARQQPKRVGRMILIGGAPNAEVRVPKFIRMLASPLGALIVRLPFSTKMARSQLAAIGHGEAVAAGRMNDFIAWRVAFARETRSMVHERAMVRAFLDGDVWRPGFLPTDADIGSIEHPVRMLFGSDDPTGSVEVWQRFVDRLPNGELQIIDAAGHMPWWDDARTVGRAVRGFMEAGPSGQGGTRGRAV